VSYPTRKEKVACLIRFMGVVSLFLCIDLGQGLAAEVEYAHPLFSVRAQNEPLLLRAVGNAVGCEIIVRDQANTPVTIQIYRQPVGRVLARLLKGKNYVLFWLPVERGESRLKKVLVLSGAEVSGQQNTRGWVLDKHPQIVFYRG